ncbi:MAG TPA: BMC domain-containing protein [Ignavibacteriales bacterium]|nr:BMC domain-containing protein [Ignavibacteriales bacterium]
MDLALGLIETKGLIGAIEAADAMAKAAEVRIISRERTDPAMITIRCIGDVAAVRAAVDAGAIAAQRVGQLISAHVIPRPDEQLDPIIIEKNNPKVVLNPQFADKNKSDNIKSDVAVEEPNKYTIEDLQQLSTTELRKIARQIENFPLHGKDISTAGKDKLIEIFKKIF